RVFSSPSKRTTAASAGRYSRKVTTRPRSQTRCPGLNRLSAAATRHLSPFPFSGGGRTCQQIAHSLPLRTVRRGGANLRNSSSTAPAFLAGDDLSFARRGGYVDRRTAHARAKSRSSARTSRRKRSAPVEARSSRSLAEPRRASSMALIPRGYTRRLLPQLRAGWIG